jgi:hypothetical protein
MARASNIYIVGACYGPEDMAAFTVKHEAQAYTRKGVSEGWLNLEDLTIIRLPDGGNGSAHHFNPSEFIA